MVLVKIDNSYIAYLSILSISRLYKIEYIPVNNFLVRLVQDLMSHIGIEFEGGAGDPEAPVFFPEPDGPLAHASHRIVLSGYDKDLLAT